VAAQQVQKKKIFHGGPDQMYFSLRNNDIFTSNA
jgi:hypothetical protein